jgi:hypothetical protein
MQAGLQAREPDHGDGFSHDLKAKACAQSMQDESLEAKAVIREGGTLAPLQGPLP